MDQPESYLIRAPLKQHGFIKGLTNPECCFGQNFALNGLVGFQAFLPSRTDLLNPISSRSEALNETCMYGRFQVCGLSLRTAALSAETVGLSSVEPIGSY